MFMHNKNIPLAVQENELQVNISLSLADLAETPIASLEIHRDVEEKCSKACRLKHFLRL